MNRYELHTIPSDELAQLQLPLEDAHTSWLDLYTRIQAKLFPHMRPDARRAVAQHFETYLDDSQVYTFTPVLRHGDFGGGNILIDSVTNDVSAIIDFGGAGLGDPAVDFAGLSTLGNALWERCLHARPDMQKMQ